MAEEKKYSGRSLPDDPPLRPLHTIVGHLLDPIRDHGKSMQEEVEQYVQRARERHETGALPEVLRRKYKEDPAIIPDALLEVHRRNYRKLTPIPECRPPYTTAGHLLDKGSEPDERTPGELEQLLEEEREGLRLKEGYDTKKAK